MIDDGSYVKLECGVSCDRHFVKDPIVLPSCGHAACKSCLPKNITADIKCCICNVETNKNLRNDTISCSINNHFETKLEQLLKIMEVKTECSLDQLKSI